MAKKKNPSPPAEPPTTLTLDASLLKADPQNARFIKDDALRGLSVSLETFGDLSGIVWNQRTGHLVAGHQRMRALGLEGAAVWVRHGDWGEIKHPKTGEVFHVRIVDWDETTERMANLTANNTAIQGEFTDEAEEQLRALEGEEMFSELRLGELQAELEAAVAKAEKDAADEGGAGDESGRVRDSYAIVVECETEEQQQKVLERLLADGLNCRALL